MNYILLVFFYSFGLTFLFFAWILNPDTAQIKDLLAILHLDDFWNSVAIIWLMLMGIDMTLSNKFYSFILTALRFTKRLQKKN